MLVLQLLGGVSLSGPDGSIGGRVAQPRRLALKDAPEFERWGEVERARLGARYAKALDRLAEDAEGRGDRAAAVEWWQRAAAHDPLSSRVALRLMQALAAAGDTAGALRHARTHEALVREELESAPDPDHAGARAVSESLAALPLTAPTTRRARALARARIAAVLGERDRAVALLREATVQGHCLTDVANYSLHTDPAFDALRGYPPARDLLTWNR